jgi:regulation of enolase protein 1 (concanavalin A-like superfamily)
MPTNLLAEATPEQLTARGFSWEHLLRWEPLPGDAIRVTVPPGTDYFRDPAGEKVKDNGPYLWLTATGDFVATLHVRPAFTGMYDAGGILVRHDEAHWAKLCFEATNFGTTAAISVVTRGLSDDANGVDLAVPDLWLQVCRVRDVFGMHYAPDGTSWRKVRRFHLALPPTVRVGLLAQSPGDTGTAVDFLWFSVERRTVANTRTGV